MSEVKKILLLSANPLETGRLRVDEEMREIKEGLKRARKRDDFTLESAEAVRYRDLRRAILENRPNIVHFSGHGMGTEGGEENATSRKLVPVDSVESGNEGLVFEDESGQVKLINAIAIAGLFKLFDDSVECVVLNACYSQVQAEAIAQYIPYVVGMGKAIGDRAAIEFAIAFYDAIGSGRNYEFAFDYACNGIDLAGIAESDTPKLLKGKAQKGSVQALETIQDIPQGTTIGNYAPNAQGSNVVSGQSFQGNTIIGTQHNYSTGEGEKTLKRPSSSTGVDRNQLLDTLKKLIPAQFNELIFLLEAPNEYLPHQNTPQSEKATALLHGQPHQGG